MSVLQADMHLAQFVLLYRDGEPLHFIFGRARMGRPLDADLRPLSTPIEPACDGVDPWESVFQERPEQCSRQDALRVIDDARRVVEVASAVIHVLMLSRTHCINA
jgi:hypothetical protein